ncbi:MAG: LysR substrate-binding domain-containing protein [Pseudomonas sp.]|uniref:LysR substrate-binding domain-containing protein n=1 Tax=Pseudomonas abieticivorans TaxID=2931382 RepID=UPI0020C154E8|nr:LysR substrate-binding domain-containing protein [Pseudomonas sp. PIA16]MDE1165364.1 LysR substrate-binding domain-containing protein [Pseudomonas sp.]
MFAKLPLTALRAFESAARLGGFKAAADELAVTPAAVSHQIKALEQSLGALLFERTGQGVRLTPTGERLASQVHESLSTLAVSLRRFNDDCDDQRLTLSTTPAFASLWLIPRLGDFHRQYPHIHVRVETSNALVDLARDASIDLALRAQFKPDPALFALPLLAEHFAVYAPPGWAPPAAPAPLELITVPWHGDTQHAVDWPAWCALSGHDDWLQRARLRQYDDEHYALQAAAAGHGLVLASDVLAANSIATGLLTAYRPDISIAVATYTAVCVPGQERRTPVREFLRWLQGALCADQSVAEEQRNLL